MSAISRQCRFRLTLLNFPRVRFLPSLLVLLIFLLFCQGCDNNQYEPIGDIDPDVPFAVTDLAATVGNDTIGLTWTATGDDGPFGTASRYDLRLYAEFITTGNWPDATPVAGLPRPRSAGTAESFTLSGDDATGTAYLALRVVDDSGNNSKLSNVIFVDRHPPAATNDLTVLRVRDQTVTLSWTAPTDDSPLGHAARYEIRASVTALTEANWADILPRNGPAKPTVAGQTEIFGLRGLSPLTHYFVALRSRDEIGNLSGLSNMIEIDTAQTPVGWWDGFGDRGVQGDVIAFYSLGDTLYVGGQFNQVGALPVGNIASWDGNDWSSMAQGVAGGSFGTRILDMEDYNGTLHIAGSFRIAGGQPVSNLARWTGDGWESLGGGPITKPPASLGTFNGDLFVGGFFNQGAGSPFTFLSRYDGVAFHSMDWNHNIVAIVRHILPHEGRLVLAGSFGEVPGTAAKSVAMWDGFGYTIPQPDLVGPWDLPFITALCEYEGDLILGGDFTSAGGITLNHIARWDGTTWHSLAGGMSGTEFPSVSALTVYRGLLIAGGNFALAGGEPANNIALWDGTHWTSLGAGVAGMNPLTTRVIALANHSGSLYVGGVFTTTDGLPSVNIGRWDLD